MIKSLRRISNALLGVGVAAITVAAVSGLVSFCGYGENCLTASVMFGVPEMKLVYESPQTTAVTTTKTGDLGSLLPVSTREFSGVIGIYLVTLAVLILTTLEFFELYYIKRLLHRRQLP